MAIKKMYGNLTEWGEITYDLLPSTSTILINTTGDDQGLINAMKVSEFKGEKGDRGYPGNVILPDGLVISSVGYTMLGQETEQEMREIINARAQYDNENSVFVTKGNIVRTNVDKEDVVAGGDLRLVPVGGIIMWSGASTAVPSGWLLCDGTNETPDLRDRFVVGVGSTYSVGSTGGSKDAIVVLHNHPASSSTSVSIYDPGHSHYVCSTGHSDSAGGYTGGGNNCNSHVGTSASGTGISASASTSTSITNSGSSGVNANLPPYYALAYIMFKGYN